MPSETNLDHEQLRQLVSSSLRRAEAYTATLRRTRTGLVIGGLVASSASTLVAGGAALQGPLLGPGPGGWQLTCGLAAILAFVSTVCMGVEEQLKLGDRLPLGQSSVGQLRALDAALTTGSRNRDKIAQDYEAIIRDSGEVFS